MLETAGGLLPGIEEKVAYSDLGTPLSLHRFTRNSEGSTGGWSYNARLSVPMRQPGLNLMRTPIRNLYAAGHYTIWPGGVISAALSGRIVARMVERHLPRQRTSGGL
jgi:prolycopene isomerase